jgi:hypothetical protein
MVAASRQARAANSNKYNPPASQPPGRMRAKSQSGAPRASSRINRSVGKIEMRLSFLLSRNIHLGEQRLNATVGRQSFNFRFRRQANAMAQYG